MSDNLLARFWTFWIASEWVKIGEKHSQTVSCLVYSIFSLFYNHFLIFWCNFQRQNCAVLIIHNINAKALRSSIGSTFPCHWTPYSLRPWWPTATGGGITTLARRNWTPFGGIGGLVYLWGRRGQNELRRKKEEEEIKRKKKEGRKWTKRRWSGRRRGRTKWPWVLTGTK